MRRLLFFGALVALLSTAVAAQDRQTLGWGRLLSNDVLGDGKDRWRTSSYMLSLVRGPDWTGARPETPGAILEYRLRAEIIAPRYLTGPGSDDRAFVGALSAGLHSHWRQGGWEMSLGLDLVALGPQTGLDELQSGFHDLFDVAGASEFVIANQAADGLFPTALAEAAWPVTLAPSASLRPFIEGQIGVEDLVRGGADLLIGEAGQGALKLRDPVTGHLLHAVMQDERGWSLALGADIAAIGDSAYFPAEFGTQASRTRWRVRAGGHWQDGARTSAFYGLTWLSPEFDGQPEGQLVGSVKLNFNF